MFVDSLVKQTEYSQSLVQTAELRTPYNIMLLQLPV